MTAGLENSNIQTSPPRRPLKKVKFLLKHLNAKNLTFGYKLGDGTSGKVFLATNTQQKTFALKQIKMKM